MDVRVGLWRRLSTEELMLLNCGAGEDSWESLGQQGDQTSQSWRKLTLNIYWKDWCWSWAPILWPADAKSRLIGKDSDAGKDWGQEKGVTEDEMVGWHHWLNGYVFEQAPGVCWNSSLLNQWCHPTILSSVIPFSSYLNFSQQLGLFPWVGSLHQVAKVLEFQFQHQSFW